LPGSGLDTREEVLFLVLLILELRFALECKSGHAFLLVLACIACPEKPEQKDSQVNQDKWHPAPDHPWRKSFQKIFTPKQADDPAAALSYG
jgi:hypothetical protein